MVFLRPDHVSVVGFKFAVKFKSGRVKIAPEFDDFAWVDSKKVKRYKTIGGIDREVAQTIKLYQDS